MASNSTLPAAPPPPAPFPVRRFQIESWTLYGTGMLIIFLRMLSRVRRLGITKLQLDDFVMINTAFWYTIMTMSLNIIAAGGGSNLMSPDEIAALTPQDIRERTKGSKWVLVSEQALLVAVWSMKCCMLMIYSRLTVGLKQRRAINYLAIYVGFGFLACELAMFLQCLPFQLYWAVPVPDSKIACATYQPYIITQTVFNISSDITMLAIALPLLFSAQLPPKQKGVVCVIFGMGMFVIVAAIITKLYCLVPSLLSLVYIFWYMREVTVAVYVTNLPLLWSLLIDAFPALKRWMGRVGSGHDYGTGGHSGLESGHNQLGSKDSGSGARKEYPLTNVSRKGKSGNTSDDDDCSSSWAKSQSQERINRQKSLGGQSHGDSDHDNDFSDVGTARAETPPLHIRQEVTFTVEEGPTRTGRSSPDLDEEMRMALSQGRGGGPPRLDLVGQLGNRYTTQIEGGAPRHHQQQQQWPADGWPKKGVH